MTPASFLQVNQEPSPKENHQVQVTIPCGVFLTPSVETLTGLFSTLKQDG
jgi:hypothetical protein